jgi:RecB family endonuclease NucS
LKRAEASIAAVQQVVGYLLALGKQEAFDQGRLDGVIVAERIPSDVLVAAENEGVTAYEAKWPFSVTLVQSP